MKVCAILQASVFGNDFASTRITVADNWPERPQPIRTHSDFGDAYGKEPRSLVDPDSKVSISRIHERVNTSPLRIPSHALISYLSHACYANRYKRLPPAIPPIMPPTYPIHQWMAHPSLILTVIPRLPMPCHVSKKPKSSPFHSMQARSR